MHSKLSIAVLALGFSAGVSAFAQGSPAARPAPDPAARVVVIQGASSPAVQRLSETADHLRASIAQLSSRPPGPERDAALRETYKALLVTQQAMLDLPAEYRVRQETVGTAGYDGSVRSLMAAADTLRNSIHAMAREPAGPLRNQAIRDANRALLDTQVAMANAYDATAFPNHAALQARTVTLGAGPANCVKLDTMRACPLH